MLVDAFGREVTDIRISVTKRCNFGCIYCHDEGLGPILAPRMPHDDEMSIAEIDRIVRVAREFGITSVKYTGGEPLVRLDMEDVIDRTVRLIPDVSMTTNGSMLAGRAEALRNAGLKRVNVSIDSLDPKVFQEIRQGDLRPVLRGIQEALRVGLKPVKLNMVVFKHTLPHIPAMIEYIGHGDGLKLQLIQFMPELVGQQDWMVDIDSLKKWLEARGQGPRTGDAPPADLPLQRGRGRGRRSGVQRGVLHELPPDSRDARRRAEGVPEPERRSPSDARPRRRGRPRRVPSGRREPGAVLWCLCEGVPAAGPEPRGLPRVPGRVKRAPSPGDAVPRTLIYRPAL